MKATALALAVLLTVAAAGAQAKDAAIDMAAVDRVLADAEPHLRGYPPRFSSPAERKRIEAELEQTISLLEAATKASPDDPELLFRDGFANAMEHNLDVPGADLKATSAYEHLLELRPEDKRANYMYGGFLAGTATKRQEAVKYLRKAAALGVVDAHYSLGYVYLTLQDSKNALAEFREYLETYPDDATARRWVSELEKGGIKFHVEEKAPPAQ